MGVLVRSELLREGVEMGDMIWKPHVQGIRAGGHSSLKLNSFF